MSLHRSAVSIERHCSGVIVAKNVVVTAAHCVDHAQLIKVYFHDEQYELMTIAYLGKNSSSTDYAILRGNTRDYPVTPLYDSRIPKYTFVTHWRSLGLLQYRTEGTYTGPDIYWNRIVHFATMYVFPGDSGGAVMDPGGTVVYGITWGSYWRYSQPHVSMLVPSYIIYDKMVELKLLPK